MKKKILIVGGCSFTFEDWNWPGHLSRILNRSLVNDGMASQGNGLISRKLIYSLTEALKEHTPEEIMVGIMWSGVDRHEFYDTKNESAIYWGWKNVENLDSRLKNPTEVVPGYKTWYILNHHWDNKESINFYGNFHNPISSMIYALEYILITQMFLKKNNIYYFMSTYMDIFSNDELMNHPEIKYLFNLIDFSKFLPVKGCHEWVKDNYANSGGFNDPDENNYIGIHPTSYGHEMFTKNVILPFLKTYI